MQGIGYLDDDTMVVIDEAKNFVEKIGIITGALQTPTGRMVFGKLINNPSQTNLLNHQRHRLNLARISSILIL